MAKTILIADDEPEILDIVESRLTSKGFSVVRASNGSGAMEILKKSSVDLAVLDVTMPSPNGFQVCRSMKDDEALSRIPVIILSARDSENDKFWGSEAGAEAYITKPYKLEELLDTVNRLLDQ